MGVHYDLGSGPVCGCEGAAFTTAAPSEVTCGGCALTAVHRRDRKEPAPGTLLYRAENEFFNKRKTGTLKEIAEALDCDPGSLHVALVSRGRGRIRTKCWTIEDGQRVRKLERGFAPDAKKPAPLTSTEKSRRWATSNPAKYQMSNRRAVIKRGMKPKVLDVTDPMVILGLRK